MALHFVKKGQKFGGRKCEKNGKTDLNDLNFEFLNPWAHVYSARVFLTYHLDEYAV